MDSREEQNLTTADYVARMRKRLDDGKVEIERQQASISDTREHMAVTQRFQEERERFESGSAD